MSTIQVATLVVSNVNFDSTGNNQLVYSANTLTIRSGGANIMVANSSTMSVPGNLTTTGTVTANIFSGSTTFLPVANSTYDLGSSSLRWRNIYTQDLHLSNGIGDYTLIEGKEELFLINNLSGKSFKFALIEVDPELVPLRSKTGSD